MSFDTLTDVPLHRIFDYLDLKTLLQSLSCTCSYLHEAVRSYNAFQLDSIPISTDDIKRIRTSIPAQNIISLMIIGSDQTQISELSEFINLQRLTLVGINYTLLNNIFTHITSTRLRTLSIKIPWLSRKEIRDIFDILLLFIHQSNVTNLLLDISDIQLKEQNGQETLFNMMQPFINILRCLNIFYCCYRSYKQILTSYSSLQSLEINHLQVDYSGNILLDLSTDIVQFRSQLTSLTLNSYELSIDNLRLLLQLTPLLKNLHLTHNHSHYDFNTMCNGFFWANFIKLNLKFLKTFQFTFGHHVGSHTSYTQYPHEIIARFKTPFWLEDKHWHVQCEFNLSTSNVIVSTQSIDPISNSETIFRCNSISATDISYVILNKYRTSDLESKYTEEILTMIDMSKFAWAEYKIKYFASLIEYTQTLTSVKVQTKHFERDCITHIISALKSAKSIQMLTFENDRNDNEIIQDLLKTLEFNSTLKVLDLNSGSLNLSSAILLSTILQYNKTITHLNIRRNRINDEIIKHLAKIFETNRTIEILDLGENNITSIGAQYLSNLLKQNEAVISLITLDLQGNSFFDKGAEYLADGLKNNKTLKTLILSYTSIEANGIKHLADSLKQNNTLTTIDLSYNKIGIIGAEHLADALKTNRALTTLILTFNQIDATNIEHLANALQINNILTTLDLRANKIGPTGAKHLANSLQYNTTLTSLNVRGNQIGSEGAQYFAELLQINKILTTLILEKNSLQENMNQ